ncbi:MAG: biotin--[acetyl-CoA-carboxylase] ligase [Chitinophagaceae bacterium]|nr:biotin--[acetyl-CoA-carboxylase] ligase [Chitinophagaceae bacterium]
MYPADFPLIELPSVDSTNRFARQLIRENKARHGMAVFTMHQTAGKGQRGKVWISEPGKNIAISIIIEPQRLKLRHPFHLSVSIALAVHDFFSQYTNGDIAIKWPNDIYWKDKKAGGILIENIFSGQHTENENHEAHTSFPLERKNNDSASLWTWAVAGIGLNINQTEFTAELPNPVSLRQITGKTFDVRRLTAELYEKVKQYLELVLHHSFQSLPEKYNQSLYKRGEQVRFKKQNRIFEAKILHVTDSGTLLVEHGIEEEIHFGEAEWLL